MINASQLKKGDVVGLDGEPHVVETVTVQTPAARGAATLYKVRFRSLKTRRKTDRTFRGDDVLPESAFERRPVQVLYGSETEITVMDLGDFSQFSLVREDIANEWPYLTEGLEGLQALVSEGRVLGLELPTAVTMTIVETAPSVKGGSATARTKPAVLSTGLVVQIPEYLAAGETIKVDTRTGAYIGRA